MLLMVYVLLPPYQTTRQIKSHHLLLDGEVFCCYAPTRGTGVDVCFAWHQGVPLMRTSIGYTIPHTLACFKSL